MTRRVACQPEPRRHWPSFSPPDLPAGLAECLVCGEWITAVDLLEGVCSGQPPVGNPLTRLDPVTVALGRSTSDTEHPFADARELERERTLAEIRRCAEHQW